VRTQHHVDRGARSGERRVVERTLAVDRCKAAGGEPLVALAQRHVQLFGQVHQHLAAG